MDPASLQVAYLYIAVLALASNALLFLVSSRMFVT